MTMKILDYRRPPASYWRVPHDNCHYFIILVIFWRMQKFICFSLTRAILYSCNLLCYNEGSGHVLMWGMISKNNYESAILCKCIWELWRHARRSYFRRFHWISESFLFHSGGVSSPLQGVTVPCDTAIYVDTALKAVAERYIVLGWTSSMISGPLLMGANQSS